MDLPVGSNGAARLPSHLSRLDRLVMNGFSEYAKATALLDRMNKMQKAPQHPGISASFKDWQDSILTLDELRRGLVGEVCHHKPVNFGCKTCIYR